MANYERGSDDVRVFDAAEDEEDVEGSRLPLLIVIALVVLAAFAAVVWLAYQSGVRQGHSEVPHEILATPGPAKVAPANPGGTATPYTGLKIYQQPAGSEEEANSDTAPDTTAKPAPATPVTTAMVKPAPEATKPAPEATKPAPATTPPPPKPATTMAMTQPKPTPPPVTAKPAPAKSAPGATASPTPLVSKPVTPAVSAPPPPKPETKPVETAAVPTALAGAGLLQIGAFKSEAEANAAWKTYKAKHASLVGGLSPDLKQVDLGPKGTWIRLRIVAGSKADAAALCTKLKADGGDCILAK